MRTISLHSRATLQSLPWDSQHFGFAVACLNLPELGDVELEESLHSARRGKVKLVYWAAEPGRVIPQSLLDEFGGVLVDRKATFQVNLRALGPESRALASCRITEHPCSEPVSGLVRLAVAAGACSRFRLDPRITDHAFQTLYEVWITRSTSGELADSVLVASPPDDAGDPLGLITLAVAGPVGTIGLVAVAEEARGQGIGSSLVGAAHRFMARRGASTSIVATQLENKAACRLYEACGYRLIKSKLLYHFWPLDRAPYTAGVPERPEAIS